MNSFKSFFKPLMWSMVVLLGALVAGCGNDKNPAPGPDPGPAPAGPVGTVCTGGTGPAAPCVNLGTAANYSILAKTGAATVPISVVNGNVGVSPVARTGLTGWSLITEPTDTAFTSAQVVAPGKLYASDNVGGTTSVDLTTAVADMQTAYTDAAGRTAGVGPNLNLGGGTVAGQNLAPGTYTWGTAVGITTDLTLTGSATDVWIFQIAGALTMDANMKVLLAGGALAKNVFWQVAGGVTMGAGTEFKGTVLGQTAITFGNLSKHTGRLLAQTAVNVSATEITLP